MYGHRDSAFKVPLLHFYYEPSWIVHRNTEDVRREDNHQLCQENAWTLPPLLVVVEEVKQLYTIALPMIITGLLFYGKSIMSMYFLGKLGKEALAGGSLSIGIANITGFSVISGLAMGMEAISSQACGARQWPLMSLTLQRTIIILLIACIPISALWIYIEPILLYFGQDPTISYNASVYLVSSILDLVLQCFINPIKIYLRSQNVTVPLMVSATFALAIHVPINYFCMYHLHFGIRGVAISVGLTDLSLLITLLLYIYFSDTCENSWQGWSLECFHELLPILCLGIPSCISLCLEWWWYELMIFFAGFLSNATEAVATMGILLQATSLVYIFPSALGLAVSTRVGNELGANRHSEARVSSLAALACSILIGLIAMPMTTIMRHVWGRVFTIDEAILSMTAMTMPVVGLCELGNCPQTAGRGVLRGSARPSLDARINLASFYGVGLPIAILMGFRLNKGLMGFWLGLLAAQLMCAVLMVLVLIRTNWIVEAKRARELTGVGFESDDEYQSLKC